MEALINIINENMNYIIIALLVMILLLFIIVISLMVTTRKLKKKYKRLTRGVNNKNLEELIISKFNEVDKASAKADEAINQCKIIKDEIKGCVNKVSVIRYKAFSDIGSDLSFSIAILDSYNDGVIITGIYSRQDSITYAKPVDKGISRYELSEEETYVLNDAINKK
ncbi:MULTISPECIES: DUF4446 family protein [unclassified Clostridium]|uniref:DUF4446 family protein n=1 Tax=unclassified Clostridium TaxID=2614128 RepID=UPI0025B84EBC|nr:DUF4446 family protein [Clostridium sp.]MCI6693591.1 DUF4446 family protein [Clostridium sp.]MDY2630470.1 DUF4446 family protein [Clostridium sp.]MDY4251920.1 DUF4446 family protein [Clostridium sp.]MDY6228015.1 DUF4446 family protein [Clostridium sp.]